jgi:hypothetical protein
VELVVAHVCLRSLASLVARHVRCLFVSLEAFLRDILAISTRWNTNFYISSLHMQESSVLGFWIESEGRANVLLFRRLYINVLTKTLDSQCEAPLHDSIFIGHFRLTSPIPPPGVGVTHSRNLQTYNLQLELPRWSCCQIYGLSLAAVAGLGDFDKKKRLSHQSKPTWTVVSARPDISCFLATIQRVETTFSTLQVGRRRDSR